MGLLLSLTRDPFVSKQRGIAVQGHLRDVQRLYDSSVMSRMTDTLFLRASDTIRIRNHLGGNSGKRGAPAAGPIQGNLWGARCL